MFGRYYQAKESYTFNMEQNITIKGVVTMENRSLTTVGSFIASMLGVVSNNLKTQYAQKYGQLLWSETVNNIVTSAGKAQIALLAGDAAAVPFTFLELGLSNTAPVIGQTALVSAIVDSGLVRSAASVSRVTTTVTNDTLQLSFTWTATGSRSVEEVGQFNAGSGGVMLGRALTGTKSLANGNIFTVTYRTTFI